MQDFQLAMWKSCLLAVYAPTPLFYIFLYLGFFARTYIRLLVQHIGHFTAVAPSLL